MDRVSGFIALDGRFFLSEDECKQHEEFLQTSKVLQERSEIIVSSFKSGAPSPGLPETLASILGDFADQEIIDA